MGWGGGRVPFLSIIIRLLSLACRCLYGLSISGAALDAIVSMMPSILWPIWISVISWPVACFASAMYNVLFFRGPVLWPISS